MRQLHRRQSRQQEKSVEKSGKTLRRIIYISNIFSVFSLGEVSYIGRSIWRVYRYVFPGKREENERIGDAGWKWRCTNVGPVYIFSRENFRVHAESGFRNVRDQIFLYINVASAFSLFNAGARPAYLGRRCYLYTVSSLCIRLCPVQWAAWQLISDQETNTSL